ncbi:MarR family winged helix-turn-helix transcriptional regulator [Streptomyces sp. NPDC092296]|uniref:MarR family winged helix-turn-helix transcriptional regulator n=1 Tax=Streptomyces sp. NPDC092296 TaxID=3366012 RepID=UPI0038048D37
MDRADLPSKPSDLPSELSGVLVGIQRLVRRRLRRGLTGSPLRGAQVELLRLVETRPGVRVSAAARELRLAGNSVSTLVNQLVSAGLLIRETDPADRRAALLRPTPEAVARLRAWEDGRTALIGEQVALLSEADRAALAAALPALRQIAQGLHDEAEAP